MTPQALVGDESDVMRAVYDAWNRLVAVKDGSGNILKAYEYDGLGRLISETDGYTTTDLYYSGTQVIEERTGVSTATGASTGSNGQVSAQYVFSPVYVNAPILRDADTNDDGTLDQQVYFTSDANFDVTSVVSTGGSVLQREVYDPYGSVAFKDASFGASSDGYGLQFLFRGMLFDSAIGWYYSGQSNLGRWYSPTMDVWDRGDVGYIDSMALDQFCGDNPVGGLDPTGMSVFVKCSLDDYLKDNGVTNYRTGRRGDWTMYGGPADSKNGNDVTSEILGRMIASPHPFYVKDGSLANLKLQVQARLAIIAFAAAKKFQFGAGADFSSNPLYWNGSDPKPGVSPFDALHDLNAGTFTYCVGCEFGTWATVLGGISDVLGKSAFDADPNGLTGKYAAPSTNDWKDWIPGDWGWIQNSNFGVGRRTTQVGLEGENIIYVGNGSYWGHFSPGNTYKSSDDCVKEVDSWGGPRAARLLTTRIYPVVGLQQP